ncbi:hypothetical protein [Sulfobacillus thermosulfidooxidans]|uniref:hypothetical protein n=1 Tax=Sulfobacillus thermosulfidooxidans TaxID=28034 RepID=UPI00096BB03C|nr:hypothetical protein [Sulfobacillus thermosulfidooxidans]OLZ08562.1 hypothetical protein BFX05_03270 [Sulfobacillus thermosulfidooxidans]OLZ13164.1 hypothetical protein BFX06_11520 [Sulfobacillus thermosulfidooxidans]OLZ21544.1 hypothetical protein BFX07_11945 [Sulfobacillus thermosulfidooxidans]
MTNTVGTLLRHAELEEIVRLLFESYSVRCVTIEPIAASTATYPVTCLIIDWLQCTSRERQQILRWEHSTSRMVVDLSGMMARSPSRRIFKPPFAWRAVVEAVLFQTAGAGHGHMMNYG